MTDESLFEGLVDNLTEGIYFLDRSRRITYWNRGAERLTGYAADEVLGRCCADNLLQHMDPKGRLLCNDGCPMDATMRDGRERAAEVFLHHKEGHRVPITVRAIPIRGANGEIVGAVEVFNDISGQALAAERVRELEALSLIDPLTGAGNRKYSEIQLASRLAENKRHGLGFGLLLVGVDGFEGLGGRHGPSAGGDALRVVGRTIGGALRAGDFLGRWGEGEFLVLAGGLDGRRLADAGERLRMLVARSSVPSIPGLALGVSVGISEARGDDTAASFVARAEASLREAASGGR